MEPLEEVLQSSSIPSALMQFIVWEDVLEGARANLVAEQVVYVDRKLIGIDGNTIQVPLATQLSAAHIAENTQMTTSDKTVTQVAVTIDKKPYSAVALTKELLEDFPSIEWVRINFRNMGKAVAEFIDLHIINHLIANTGQTYGVATGGTLTYADVINAIATMEQYNYNPQFLIINPLKKGDLLNDTNFIQAQHQYYKFSNLLQGELGIFADQRVLVTTQIASSHCLLVISPYDNEGPAAVVAYKRDLTVTRKRDEDYDRTRWFTTARYGMNTVRATGILVITGC